MTTYIKKSEERVVANAGTQRGASFTSLKIPVRKRQNRDTLKVVGVVSILGLGLTLSILNDFLFFKELAVASAIVGMTMLLKAAQHPAIIISRDDDERAHLN